MDILLSWLHFCQAFLIGLGILLAIPLVVVVVKLLVNAVSAIISLIRMGFRKD